MLSPQENTDHDISSECFSRTGAISPQFSALISELNNQMHTEFHSVNSDVNPIATLHEELSPQQITQVLGQYSWFSKSISKFLLDAFYATSSSGWSGVSEELMQNISEELETEGGKLPHYVLLKQGVQDGLGVDLGDVAMTPSTQGFVSGVVALVNDPDPAVVTGACYALESSATPELEMVYGWTKKLFSAIDREVPKSIQHFFESHIDEIEVLHEQRLQEQCSAYIQTPQQEEAFRVGFRGVISIMDRWWSGLAQETQNT